MTMAILSETKLLPLLARSTKVALLILVLLLQLHDCSYYEFRTQEDADALMNYKAANEEKILADAKICAKYITDQVNDAAKNDVAKCKNMFGNCCWGSWTKEEDSFCAIYCWSGPDPISDHSTADNIWNLYRCFQSLKFDFHQRWVRATVQRLFSEPLCVNNGGDRKHEYWASTVDTFAKYIADKVKPETAKVPDIWFQIRGKSTASATKQSSPGIKKLVSNLKDKLESTPSVGAAPAQAATFKQGSPDTKELISFLDKAIKDEIETPCKKASFFRFKVKLSLACATHGEEFAIACESDSKFGKLGSDFTQLYPDKSGYGVEKVALYKAVCIPEFMKGIKASTPISRKNLLEKMTEFANAH